MSRNPLPRTSTRQFTGYADLSQVEEMFWSKVDQRGPDECWPWTASRHQRGYGQFRAKAFPIAQGAHRWAFYFTHGHLPEHGEVAHSCDNPPCCNPAHLQDSTRLANERHKDEAGRRPRGVTETPCSKCGGPRTGRGRRDRGREYAYCISCRREYHRLYGRARRAEEP